MDRRRHKNIKRCILGCAAFGLIATGISVCDRIGSVRRCPEPGATAAVARLAPVVPLRAHAKTAEDAKSNAGPFAKAESASLCATGEVTRAQLVLSLLREAETEPSARACEEVIRNLDQVLSETNCTEIMRSLPSDVFTTVYGMKVLDRWVAQDRLAAAEWLARCPQTDMAQAVTLMHGWQTENPTAMRDYVQSLSSGHWKLEVLKAAAWEAIETGDLTEAMRWAQQLGPDDDRDGELLSAIRAVAANPQAAVEGNAGSASAASAH